MTMKTDTTIEQYDDEIEMASTRYEHPFTPIDLNKPAFRHLDPRNAKHTGPWREDNSTCNISPRGVRK